MVQIFGVSEMRVVAMGVLVGGILLGAGRWGSAAEAVMAKDAPRLELKAIRDKSTKIEGGDWDDKRESIQVDVTVRNLELNRAAEGLTGHLWVIAESAIDRKAYKVVQRESFPVSLTNTPEGREVTFETKEVELRWDNTGVKFGERYEGWLLVVTNAAGEVVANNCTTPSFGKSIGRAMRVDAGDWVDMNFNPIKQPQR